MVKCSFKNTNITKNEIHQVDQNKQTLNSNSEMEMKAHQESSVEVNNKEKGEQISELIELLRFGKVEKTKEFLNAIQNPNDILNTKSSDFQQTPIYTAVQFEDHSIAFELTRILIEKGANANTRDIHNQSPIFYICKDGKTDLLQYLNQQGQVEAEETDNFQQSPMFYAAREGQTECIRQLVALGANPNHKDKVNETAMFYAARDGKIEAVRALLELGADPTIVDHKRQTALYFAKKNGHKEVIDLLVEKGVLNAKENRSSRIANNKQKKEGGHESKSNTSTPAITKKKRIPGNEVVRISFKLQYTNPDLTTRDLTDADFEAFSKEHPNLSELLLNPDLLAFNPEIRELATKETWQSVAGQLMTAVWKVKSASYFYAPVDYEKLCIPDYPTIIKKPMDFGTIKKKLTANVYPRLEDFLEDLELVFKNCALYNGTQSGVGLIGTQVKSEVDSLIKEMHIVKRFGGQEVRSNWDIPPLRHTEPVINNAEVTS